MRSRSPLPLEGLLRRRSRPTLAILLGAGLCALAAGAATLRGPASVESLARSADVIVRAKVTSTHSAWGDGGPKSGVIFTTVLLAPSEWWKGAGGAQVVVRTQGGSVGEWDQTVHGAAAFREGEEVVVFLTRRQTGGAAALFEVEKWALGKFAVAVARPGKPGGVRVARDRTGLTCAGCGADEEDELALEELRGRVLAAALGRK